MHSKIPVSWILSAFIMVLSSAFTSAKESGESDFARSMRPAEAVMSRENAKKYLRSLPLSPLEGIWEYPADDVTLLILRSRHDKGKYEIYLLESVDCRLSPGMLVGEAVATADKSQFSMTLRTRLKRGMLCSPAPCAGKLSSDAEVLYIKAPKVKISLTPSIFLPTLWHTLRLGVRIRTENPSDKLPDGWRKTFPTFDGNEPSASTPRYL